MFTKISDIGPYPVKRADQDRESGDVSVTLTDQAKVYSARMRLVESTDQADALEAVREIAANLMGCEELALFKLEKKVATLWLYWSFGIDPNKYAYIKIPKHPNLLTVIEGKIILKAPATTENLLRSDDTINGLVPIRVDGEITGVLVLFRLLAHKPAFEPVDLEICDVISNLASLAFKPRSQQSTQEGK